ncbi:FxsB family cyclophane-forming radical SAM/SPASM peptide maturase [Pseudonocardia humida]|uniref:FxsB family radical SAM/SPASM domain protein n=1 Tax=Pseudonocardia humida TaxID=2800819 RepID=A0ABT1ABV0_9PSEU|nr:FxsB family cyclophane-forming radical SAM/SPASM peptide maturase [Pseudonocardia humida]MCO1660423.1 FxsB family radical SAM/SPASM domain protein [Pseudonocardia humida]
MHEQSRPAPHPFHQFLLKVHSRCDLACDYCYVYTLGDRGWAERPTVMSRRTVEQAAGRIAEHVRAHALPAVGVALHGGEPLLAGLDEIEHCVRTIRRAAGHLTDLRFAVQTNAVRLDAAGVARLRRLGVRIGVSLDGDAAAHDRHRRRRSGTGTHGAVAAALDELRRPDNTPAYAGLLCTVDLANDPVTTYEALVAHDPPQIDFLLPEGNWTAPPPGRVPGAPDAPYGDWLCRVFDRWYDHPVRETSVRLFDDVLNLLLGGRATVTGTGLLPTASIVVQTDGAIDVCDALTATLPGAGATGLSVADDPFDAALAHPLVRERQAGPSALADTCRTCAIVEVCGGGAHTQRWAAGAGFTNPSVYCPDLYRLITHIRTRLAADVDRLRAEAG